MRAYPPGFESVNRVRDLLGFLRRWENRDELTSEPLPLAVAAEGNINLHGTARFSESLLLSRWHPSFAACVEPGVRELVMRLVSEWDCVTYSSCEGHPSSRDAPARVRHVRLLARSEAEHTRLSTMLARLADLSSTGAGEYGVLVTRRHSVVRSSEGLQAPGLDLVFEPRSADEGSYWELLNPCYRRCLSHVGDVAGTGGAKNANVLGRKL